MSANILCAILKTNILHLSFVLKSNCHNTHWSDGILLFVYHHILCHLWVPHAHIAIKVFDCTLLLIPILSYILLLPAVDRKLCSGLNVNDHFQIIANWNIDSRYVHDSTLSFFFLSLVFFVVYWHFFHVLCHLFNLFGSALNDVKCMRLDYGVIVFIDNRANLIIHIEIQTVQWWTFTKDFWHVDKHRNTVCGLKSMMLENLFNDRKCWFRSVKWEIDFRITLS